jgi:hypothetical protein
MAWKPQSHVHLLCTFTGKWYGLQVLGEQQLSTWEMYCIFRELQLLQKFLGMYFYLYGELGSSVSIVSDYGQLRFDPCQRRKDFSSSLCPDRLWGPPSLLYNGYQGGGVLSPGIKHGRGMMLTTHSHLVPRSRWVGAISSLPPSAFMACSGTALALFLLVCPRHNM